MPWDSFDGDSKLLEPPEEGTVKQRWESQLVLCCGGARISSASYFKVDFSVALGEIHDKWQTGANTYLAEYYRLAGEGLRGGGVSP